MVSWILMARGLAALRCRWFRRLTNREITSVMPLPDFNPPNPPISMDSQTSPGLGPFQTMAIAGVFTLLGFLPLFLSVWRWRRETRQREASTKKPQSEKILRPPGHSLSEQIAKLEAKENDAMLLSFGCGMVGSLLTTVGLLLLTLYVLTDKPHLVSSILNICSGLAAIGGSIYFARKWTQGRKEMADRQLGLRGEQAVAEFLAEAGELGFRSYHDLEGEADWNIDHVGVGTRGVFLIETKARTKFPSKNPGQHPDHEAWVDGPLIRFPTFDDSKTTNQAQGNARWLSNYLRGKTGESIFVMPLVVIPGWFVKLKSKDCPVMVLSAKQLPAFLKNQNQGLDPKLVTQIRTALAERCRDLEF